MLTFFSDLRLAARVLACNPGVTALSLLSLALAIGPNIALFSLVDRFLLRPPDGPAVPDVYHVRLQARSGATADPSYLDFVDYRAAAGESARLFGFTRGNVLLAASGSQKMVSMAFVTENYFQVLQVAPVLGRALAESDRQVSGVPPVMISHSLWQREFGGDPDVIGRSLLLNASLCSVVGVAPRGYRPPVRGVTTPDVWMPVGAVPVWGGGSRARFVRRDARDFQIWVRLHDARAPSKRFGAPPRPGR